MKRNSKRASKKREVTLMTLLANEATSDSRKLLKEYNQADAKSEADLEQKLANLYFGENDKIEIEKKLANIHPHKNWLVKTLDLTKKDQPKIGTGSLIIDEKLNDVKSVEDSKTLASSSFDGNTKSTQEIKTNNSNTLVQTVTLLGIFSIIGLTFIIVSKNLNK